MRHTIHMEVALVTPTVHSAMLQKLPRNAEGTTGLQTVKSSFPSSIQGDGLEQVASMKTLQYSSQDPKVSEPISRHHQRSSVHADWSELCKGVRVKDVNVWCQRYTQVTSELISVNLVQ